MPRRLRPPTYVWMVVFRPDEEARPAGLEDECFTQLYARLERAQTECSIFLEKTRSDEPDFDPSIDWMEDQSSSQAQRVMFGRPREDVDGNFYLYEMTVEM